MMLDQKYNQGLRQTGPKAKALRDAARKLLDLWQEAEIKAYAGPGEDEWREVGLDADMAIGSINLALGFHVAHGTEPAGWIRRAIALSKTKRVTALLEKLAKALEGGK
jgi:hypothetical protein